MPITMPKFTDAKVLIAGDVMLDSYFQGSASRISPEAPVPIIQVANIEERAGGAANVAINISALGGKVKLLGFVGEDAEAGRLKKILSDYGVDQHLISIPDFTTINKLRVVGRNQQLLRLDFEKKLALNNPQMERYFQALQELFAASIIDIDLVILSDYGKGSLNCVQNLIQIAKAKNIPILIDPKSKDFGIYRGATLVTPNLDEFEAVAGFCDDEKELVQKAKSICNQHELDALLVTRGEHGMSLISKNQEPLHLPTVTREVYDVTGAGDTVIAVMGAALAAKADLLSAVKLANAAAGIVVQKFGAAAVSSIELQTAIQSLHQANPGILSADQLLKKIAAERANGAKIIMTNGCFDILHPGHVSYLEQAKALGDRLIVAVNDDASVSRLKGLSRPINHLRQRMQMLAALRAVDWVVSFSEDTPELLISRVMPDILVKGGDYKEHEIAGAEFVVKNGGKVKIIPLLEGFSTRALIDKLSKK